MPTIWDPAPDVACHVYKHVTCLDPLKASLGLYVIFGLKLTAIYAKYALCKYTCTVLTHRSNRVRSTLFITLTFLTENHFGQNPKVLEVDIN